jgi:eukaryotic-like serine/threonine-protein kinase
MGDADQRAGVQVTDELDTMDGAEPRVETPASAPMPAGQGARDYAELMVIERRHYEIKREIGRGGIGRVFEARDLRLGRDVAIKELLPKSRDAERRFIREARITSKLQHPAIIHIYEAGRWKGGEAFYAMPHVDGLSLDRVVADRRTLAERLALLPNVIAVVDALAYAHDRHVIHRDIKPHNVLVGKFGETVVIDWGLAMDLEAFDASQSLVKQRPKADETGDGSVVGTPAYMAPEQARGERVRIDQRSDVYSLGALLYHVLVGKAPYSDADDTTKDVLERVVAGPCTNIAEREANTPPDLVAIVNKAMSREQDDRYDSAGELAADLKKFQNGQLVAARRYSRRELVVRWLRRNAVVVGISTAALTALAIGAAVSITQVLDEKAKAEDGRYTLLEERGRSELVDGQQAGRAIVYLFEAAHDGKRGDARRLLIADAIRPFDALLKSLPTREAAFTAKGDIVALEPAGITVHSPGGTLIRSFGGSKSHSRVLTAANRVITVDDDHVIRVWSETGELIRELGGHTDDILDAHVSPSGRSLVTGSEDGTARVWDLATGEQRIATCGGGLPVVAVRFSPNAELVVSATDDNTLCLWSAPTGVEISPLRGHKGRVRTIRWNPDQARSLVLTASDDGTARVWNPFKGKAVMVELRHDGGAIASAEWSSDGRLVVTAGADKTARLWEIPDHIPEDDPTLKAKELRRFVGHGKALDAAVFDATDLRIATASYDKKAKVWDVASAELIATFEHADVVSTIAFSPTGDRLLTASNDRVARLWDLAKGSMVRTPYELGSSVRAVAVARDGAVAAADAYKVTVWRGTAGPVTLRDHDGRVFAVAYSPDGTRLASGGEDDTVIVWAGEKPLTKLKPHAGSTASPPPATRAIAFAPDGNELATAGDDGIVRRWSVAGALTATLDVHVPPIVHLVYSPDGAHIAALDNSGHVIVWNRANGVPVIYANLTTGLTHAIAFSDEGTRLVAGGADTKIYAVVGGRILATRSLVALDGPFGEVHAVAFTRDGTAVITGGSDGLVQLWDAAKGKLLGTRGARGGAIDSLAVTADGKTVWAGGADQLVRGWNIQPEPRDLDDLAGIVERRGSSTPTTSCD